MHCSRMCGWSIPSTILINSMHNRFLGFILFCCVTFCNRANMKSETNLRTQRVHKIMHFILFDSFRSHSFILHRLSLLVATQFHFGRCMQSADRLLQFAIRITIMKAILCKIENGYVNMLLGWMAWFSCLQKWCICQSDGIFVS